MRKMLLLLVASFWLVVSVMAQDNQVVISWPPPVYVLSGTVAVRGTVNPPDLQSYFLEISRYGDAPTQWLPASTLSKTPVTDEVLAQLVTTVFPDGVYQLRLHVLLRSGQNLFYTVGPLRIANELETPVGEGIAPPSVVTAAPAEPTLVARPNPVNELPVPVGGQVTYFTEDTIATMKSAGMTWVKWQTPFALDDTNFVNGARDRINWSHAAGFNVLLSITGSVEELAAQGKDYYAVYAQALGQVAALHPDAIEVWNEMNLDREWPQGQIDPRAYAEMLRQAYEAIKAADPEVMVITGALAPTGAEGAFGLERVWNDDRYYLGMANAGVADYADCIGVHYNEGIIAPKQQGGDPRQPDYPTRYFPLMIQRAAYPFRNTPIPLCFTELGYLSPEGYGPLPKGFEWAVNTSVQEQAEWLRDAVQIAAQFSSARVALIIVFNMDFDRYDTDPQAGYAIIRPGGECPACEALGSLRGNG